MPPKDVLHTEDQQSVVCNYIVKDIGHVPVDWAKISIKIVYQAMVTTVYVVNVTISYNMNI